MTMKKLIIALALLIAPVALLQTHAQGLFSNKEYDGGRQDLSAYIPGTVPVENGMVTFKKIFEIPLKKESLYLYLSQWAALRYSPTTERGKWPAADFFRNTEYARIQKADKENCSLKIQGNEELIFTNKTLSKDYSIVSYILNIEMEDGKVSAEISNIAYTYNLSENPERIYAEDWITDSESFNRSGKLRKVNGKFRVKTIDLKDAIFDEIQSTLSNIR